MSHEQYYAQHGSFFSPNSPGLPGIIANAQRAAIDATYGAPQTSEYVAPYHDLSDIPDFEPSPEQLEAQRLDRRKRIGHDLGSVSLEVMNLVNENKEIGKRGPQAIIDDILSGANMRRANTIEDHTARLLGRDAEIKAARFSARNIFTAGSVVRGIKKELGYDSSPGRMYTDEGYVWDQRYETAYNMGTPGVQEAVIEAARSEAEAAGVHITPTVDIAENIHKV